MPFPQVFGQQLGPSLFSRELLAWKINLAAALKGSTLSVILSGFYGSWSPVEAEIHSTGPKKGPAEPPLNNYVFQDTTLEWNSFRSLHVGLRTLVSEMPLSSYSSSLQLSDERDTGVLIFPQHQDVSICKRAYPSSSERNPEFSPGKFKLGHFGELIPKSHP